MLLDRCAVEFMALTMQIGLVCVGGGAIQEDKQNQQALKLRELTTVLAATKKAAAEVERQGIPFGIIL